MNHLKAKSRHVPGENELWIFILGDMFVFFFFFCVWSIQHTLQPALFQLGKTQMNLGFGLINTIALLTASLFVALGLQSARRAQYLLARKFYIAAFAMGLLFVVIKFFEYREKVLAGFNPLNNDFFMYYFIFTGIHLIHVLVGLIALLMMIARCGRPQASSEDIPFLEGAGVYWHMVDVLWIVLFLLIYLL
ncbi:cytochrome c oxidase subunit 3 [Acinetobacter lactucae]|uniref:cytochrome c oxidase subunit 3 n=1 Tax=Acinetobacter lactucae TaxID=1785128 RepID=UPI00077E38BF|nr:cytochrome c oxidase subunit 3 [Acinetobacter lactucae]